MTESNITAKEIFERLDYAKTASGIEAKSIMHAVLVLLCSEGLKGSGHAFGNLMSQTDTLCRCLGMRQGDIRAVQKARHDSNSSKEIAPTGKRKDCNALALLAGLLFKTAVPPSLKDKEEQEEELVRGSQTTNVDYIRCIVRSWNGYAITAVGDVGSCSGEFIIDLAAAPEYVCLDYLTDLLCEGMQLNLLDCRVESNKVVPRLVVVEPDFLLDVSVLAGCFEQYGHHPLNYITASMRPRANNQSILLGNMAGTILDDVINKKGDYSLSAALRRNFKEKALEYATCPDFAPEKFKTDTAVQSSNISRAVADLFAKHDQDKALLEPTFICERLGIQGRVDLMTTDMRLLVEQKSGRNMGIERRALARHGALYIENHYVQLLLYFGMLRYNFALNKHDVDMRLLYSKYSLPEGLVEVSPLDSLFQEAIKLRNSIVALLFKTGREGMSSVLDDITVETINTEKANDWFFNRFLLPQIEAVTQPLKAMSPLMRKYFCHMADFVIREQILAKVGSREGIGNCTADLWNMPFEEKKETGNIYSDLTIKDIKAAHSAESYDTIVLNVPFQGDNFLANFRQGDMVYLYSYDRKNVPDVRKNILLRGVLEEIGNETLTVHLNNAQQNDKLLNKEEAVYAVEHSDSDIGTTSAMSALFTLVTAPQRRSDILLSQREPEYDAAIELSRSYNTQYDDVLLKAMQAKDFFLLIGPPGTGKTSMALRYIVEEQLSSISQGDVLLTAYTNRAVDEICSMLCVAGIDFLRLGNEFSCDPQYRDKLIGSIAENNPQLGALRRKIEGIRVVVGTTATLAARPFIFALKHFALAIADEAGQITEPNIIGLLAAYGNKGGQKEAAVDKFILVGDYKQLPAVVRQSATTRIDEPSLLRIGLRDCRESLFERLIRNERAAGRNRFIGVLNRQGRMHPAVADFACDFFYGTERILPVPLQHQREKTLGYDAPARDDLERILQSRRMVFIATKDSVEGGSDHVNSNEAVIVADVLQRLRGFWGSSFDVKKSVGVIVPYRNQISMIRRKIAERGIEGIEQLCIDTVERFQGSQRDVIIYSFTVRRRYQLEFLTENCFEDEGQTVDRKLNVAMTRARKQLIMTGDPMVLSHNKLFSQLIAYVKENGGYYNYEDFANN